MYNWAWVQSHSIFLALPRTRLWVENSKCNIPWQQGQYSFLLWSPRWSYKVFNFIGLAQEWRVWTLEMPGTEVNQIEGAWTVSLFPVPHILVQSREQNMVGENILLRKWFWTSALSLDGANWSQTHVFQLWPAEDGTNSNLYLEGRCTFWESTQRPLLTLNIAQHFTN